MERDDHPKTLGSVGIFSVFRSCKKWVLLGPRSRREASARGHPRRATGARRTHSRQRRGDAARATSRRAGGAQSLTGNDGGRDAIGSTFRRPTAQRGQKSRINRCRDGRQPSAAQRHASKHQQRQSSKGSRRSGESDPAAGERRAGPAALLISKHPKSSRTQPARRHFSYC